MAKEEVQNSADVGGATRLLGAGLYDPPLFIASKFTLAGLLFITHILGCAYRKWIEQVCRCAFGNKLW
jgi:hypothetical protein